MATDGICVACELGVVVVVPVGEVSVAAGKVYVPGDIEGELDGVEEVLGREVDEFVFGGLRRYLISVLLKATGGGEGSLTVIIFPPDLLYSSEYSTSSAQLVKVLKGSTATVTSSLPCSSSV